MQEVILISLIKCLSNKQNYFPKVFNILFIIFVYLKKTYLGILERFTLSLVLSRQLVSF